MTAVPVETSDRNKLIQWLIGISVATVAWLFAYSQLTAFADWIVEILGLTRQTRFGEAVHFFFYDSPKVVLLLTGIVFVMGIIQTFFSPERTRAMLSGKREGVGNVLAASLGIVTPFCSCSAVPLFIGFLSAGVPLGVTFSFLISAPMVNEVALVLLFGMFGWKVALLYLGLALVTLAALTLRGVRLRELDGQTRLFLAAGVFVAGLFVWTVAVILHCDLIRPAQCQPLGYLFYLSAR